MEHPDVNPPYTLKLAITMLTLAALHRRHHAALDLRLFELHPGGGQYDCLGLMGPRGMLCQCNLAGTGLLLDPIGPPRRLPQPPPDYDDATWRYPSACFRLGGPEPLAEAVAARLGLPDRPAGPDTPPSVALGVLAELAHRHALSANPVVFRSGWLDSSGYDGSEIRPWVSAFPALHARAAAAGHWRDAANAAGRLWAVTRRDTEATPSLVVDLGSGDVYGGGVLRGNLSRRFGAGEGIRALAWWLESLVH